MSAAYRAIVDFMREYESKGGARQKEDDMGYDSEGGYGAPLRPYKEPRIRSRQDEDEADRQFIAHREAQKAQGRGNEADQKLVKPEVASVAEVIVKILRKIHDPNKLTQFQKDLALVAVGAETLDWLKKEWS